MWYLKLLLCFHFSKFVEFFTFLREKFTKLPNLLFLDGREKTKIRLHFSTCMIRFNSTNSTDFDTPRQNSDDTKSMLPHFLDLTLSRRWSDVPNRKYSWCILLGVIRMFHCVLFVNVLVCRTVSMCRNV